MKENRKKNTTPHPVKKTGEKARNQQRKHQENLARIEAWQALSPEEKLKSLDDRGMAAEKQRKRIKQELLAEAVKRTK